MSRREFLLSICGAATTLLALDACTREAHHANPSATTSGPGGSYSIPPEATVEPRAGAPARSAAKSSSSMCRATCSSTT